jgi:hypothetical protein
MPLCTVCCISLVIPRALKCFAKLVAAHAVCVETVEEKRRAQAPGVDIEEQRIAYPYHHAA